MLFAASRRYEVVGAGLLRHQRCFAGFVRKGQTAQNASFELPPRCCECHFTNQTPYPGTALHARMRRDNRIVVENWYLYGRRKVVFRPALVRPEALKSGFDWAYRELYKCSAISHASLHRGSLKHERAFLLCHLDGGSPSRSGTC